MITEKKYLLLIILFLLITAGAIVLIYCFNISNESQTIEARISQYTETIWKYCEKYSIPTELVKSIIRVESKGDPDAISSKGAIGLMQVTPIAEKDVIQRFKHEPGDLSDPEYNINTGIAYLRILFDKYDNQIYYILAAYHAGPTKVNEWKRKNPGKTPEQVIQTHAYDETKQYIRDVLNK